MEKVFVNTNYLRLLGKTFMHLQPKKNAALKLGHKYALVTEDYGEVGTVEILHMFEKDVYDVSPMVKVLAFGDEDLFKHTHLTKFEKVQVCTMRFIKRSDARFTEIVDCEAPKAGLTITRQSTIF